MSESALDLRDRPPAERHEAVFEAFDTLEPGGTLTILNDHDPSPLLHQMVAERPAFDDESSVIEQLGDERYKATLEKRKTGPPGGGSPDASEEVLVALRTVTDPDLGVNVVDSGLVSSVTVESNTEPPQVAMTIDTAGVDQAALEELTDKMSEVIRRETGFDSVEIRRPDPTSGPGVAADEVLDRLADVGHPDRPSDVVESGVVTDVEITGQTVTVTVDDPNLSGDLDDYRGEFLKTIGAAAYNAHGVAAVRIDIGDAVVPIDPPQNEDPPLADAPGVGGPPGAEGPSPLEHGATRETTAPPTLDLSGIDDIVMVASAKGGVGKTTVATQLARCLAKGDQSVGLLDADFSGPDVPQLLGLEPRITEGSVIDPIDHGGIEVMSVGLMENRPTAWNGEMVHNALFNLLEDVDWTADTLVVDLPPGASDTLMTFLQFVPIDGVVLVTTPYPTSIADTNEGATLFKEGDIPVIGAVVNMTRFACPGCGEEHDLFPAADFETALEYPVIAELPFDVDLRSFTGAPPDRLTTLAETVIESLPAPDADPSFPDEAVDVRGIPDHGRVETVVDAFVGLEANEPLTVVSDRHPAGLAVALVDVMGADGPPSEVLAEYDVTAQTSDTWVLRVCKPTDQAPPRS